MANFKVLSANYYWSSQLLFFIIPGLDFWIVLLMEFFMFE